MVRKILLSCLGLFLLGLLSFKFISKDVKFVPDSFVVPLGKATSNFSFVKVSPQFTKLDFEALMSAKEFIREQLNSEWPSDEFTLKENTESLVGDLTAFNERENFTFHIFDAKKTKLIGCFYISQTYDEDSDAAVFIWVRKEFLSTPQFEEIKDDIHGWISKSWPFNNVDYSLNKS